MENKKNKDDLLEELAALEHEQWMKWSKELAKEEDLSDDRVKRWKKDWKPYGNLPDDVQEFDREWAQKVLDIIKKEKKASNDRISIPEDTSFDVTFPVDGLANRNFDIFTGDAKEKLNSIFRKLSKKEVLYHGSSSTFDVFDMTHVGQQGSTEGRGFYFTDNKELAMTYARGESGQFIEAIIDIKKPMSLDQRKITDDQLRAVCEEIIKRDYEALSNYGEDINYVGKEKTIDTTVDAVRDIETDIDIIADMQSAGILSAQEINEVFMKVTGYDSVVTAWPGRSEKIVVVFTPEQIEIKSRTYPTEKTESVFRKLESDEDHIDFDITEKENTHFLTCTIKTAHIDEKHYFGIGSKPELEKKKEYIMGKLEGVDTPIKILMAYDIKYGAIEDAKKDFDVLCKENDIDYVVIGAEGLSLFGYKRFTMDYDVVLSEADYEKVKQVASKYGFHSTTESKILEPAIIHKSGTHLHILVEGDGIPSIQTIRGDGKSPSVEGLVLTKLLYINNSKYKTDIIELMKLGIIDNDKLHDFLVEHGYEKQWDVFKSIFLDEGGVDRQIKKEMSLLRESTFRKLSDDPEKNLPKEQPADLSDFLKPMKQQVWYKAMVINPGLTNMDIHSVGPGYSYVVPTIDEARNWGTSIFNVNVRWDKIKNGNGIIELRSHLGGFPKYYSAKDDKIYDDAPDGDIVGVFNPGTPMAIREDYVDVLDKESSKKKESIFRSLR